MVYLIKYERCKFQSQVLCCCLHVVTGEMAIFLAKSATCSQRMNLCFSISSCLDQNQKQPLFLRRKHAVVNVNRWIDKKIIMNYKSLRLRYIYVTTLQYITDQISKQSVMYKFSQSHTNSYFRYCKLLICRVNADPHHQLNHACIPMCIVLSILNSMRC